MSRRPNSKTFDKKKAQLVKTLERAQKLCVELAERQIKNGANVLHATASRWVGDELDVLVVRAEALNE